MRQPLLASLFLLLRRCAFTAAAPPAAPRQIAPERVVPAGLVIHYGHTGLTTIDVRNGGLTYEWHTLKSGQRPHP